MSENEDNKVVLLFSAATVTQDERALREAWSNAIASPRAQLGDPSRDSCVESRDHEALRFAIARLERVSHEFIVGPDGPGGPKAAMAALGARCCRAGT